MQNANTIKLIARLLAALLLVGSGFLAGRCRGDEADKFTWVLKLKPAVIQPSLAQAPVIQPRAAQPLIRPAAVDPLPVWTGERDALERQKISGRPVLYLATSLKFCPGCRTLAPLLKRPAVMAELANWNCVEVDASSAFGRRTARHPWLDFYAVDSLPAFVVRPASGQWFQLEPQYTEGALVRVLTEARLRSR